jgi:maleate isomerase
MSHIITSRQSYGAAATVGVIDLSTCTSLTPEFAMAVPSGVNILFSRLRLPGGVVTVESLQEMVDSARFREAAIELADAGVGAIAFACTSASLLLGPGFDRELATRLEAATSTPATTTATAMLDALRALGAQRVSVGAPYEEEITSRERDFLVAAGFEVAAIEGLGLRRDREIGSVTFDQVRALARRVGSADSDAVFLSCTNMAALPLLAELEEELGRPVITSNAATIWSLLAKVGCRAEKDGLGLLLSPAGPAPSEPPA